ncbi:ABC transporter permease [Paenibacillus cymbidii]|uniref:ABC transporter permease n=1 Tax=Paenibacillus cymbidii TaxID=1639034 RepID=UPI001080EEC9|nr:ABC transporter permease subunit [Paenibacillus cymbidii]
MNRTAKRRTFFYYLKNDWDLYVMILPAIVLFFIFKYIPMYGVTIAFKKYDLVKGIFASDWVGFKYFVQFFNDPYFFRIVKNTLMINVYSLIFVFPAPIVLALLLNELKSERLKRIAQSFSYLPHFISTVVVVGILMKLAATDGVINALLGSLGLPEQSFFGDARWFRTLYISSDIWQGVGWGSILYLAALTGVPLDRYEAAVIDGANRWQQMKHITLPGIMPTIVILFILNMGHMLEVGFEKVYLMYNPAIYDTADVISTYVYRRGIQGLDFGYAAAIGLFDSVVAFILLVTVNQMSKKLGQESLW